MTPTRRMLPRWMTSSLLRGIWVLSQGCVSQRLLLGLPLSYPLVTQLLYSNYSSACIINREYADPANFDQVFDIFSTQSLTSARSVVDNLSPWIPEFTPKQADRGTLWAHQPNPFWELRCATPQRVLLCHQQHHQQWQCLHRPRIYIRNSSGV